MRIESYITLQKLKEDNRTNVKMLAGRLAFMARSEGERRIQGSWFNILNEIEKISKQKVIPMKYRI